MAVNTERDWLIAYDITDPKRLLRVHRYLSQHAMAQQYSVFRACMSTTQLRRVKTGLARLIDPSEDDVRMYPLPAQADVARLGRLDLQARGVFLA